MSRFALDDVDDDLDEDDDVDEDEEDRDDEDDNDATPDWDAEDEDTETWQVACSRRIPLKLGLGLTSSFELPRLAPISQLS